MSVEENRTVDRRYFEEVLNKGRVKTIDEIMAPEYVGHVPGFPPSNREEDKQMIKMFHTAFPDLKFEFEDQIAEGDKVVHRITARGTHLGEFMNFPPTGKQVVVTGININRFANGKVVESWGILDMMGMLQQLGVVVSVTDSQKDF